METSILKSTKKLLGIAADYTAFDLDIITHINSAFLNLNQLGVGPTDGFFIEDDEAKWEDLELSASILEHWIKTYIYLKVRMMFDPPTTSFLIEAVENRIREHEWRLSVIREGIEHPLTEVSP